MNKQEIIDEIRNSAFSLSCTHVSDVHLKRFLKGLLVFTKYSDSDDIDNVFNAIPRFQRDNNKWSVEMQHDFIKNVIKGLRFHVTMYEVNKNPDKLGLLSDCYILDGLQRITAIHAFITGKFTVFGKTYQELVDDLIITGTSMPITIKVFSFTSEAEAINFYIDINKGMTHSNEDIERARKVLDAVSA